MSPTDSLEALPGGALVRQGLEDFSAGRLTVPACLVGVASQTLRRAGLLPLTVTRELPDAELQLYQLLRQQGGDAFSRYNALLRELVSFEQALQHTENQKAEKRKQKSR